MLIGKVLGELSLSKTMPEAGDLKWVRVRTENDNEIVALNHVGARKEDTVLMCASDAAWRSCQCCPVDMAVVGVVGEAQR